MSNEENMEITYSVCKCSLGNILIAETPKGLCFIGMGRARAALIRELRSEFKNSHFKEQSHIHSPFTKKILSYLDEKKDWESLPVDVEASSFQRKVWNYLKQIPEGETRFYSDIADDIGRPKGARAVAKACATNPVSLAIPCHRVIPKSGGLGGYRWGVERKEKLLEKEYSKKNKN